MADLPCVTANGKFSPTRLLAYNLAPCSLESGTSTMVLFLKPIDPFRKEEATEPGFAELSVVALTRAVEVEG